jgi:hypothetical protein
MVMAGVDLLTVQTIGGWRDFKMVQRYAHLCPGHLHAAVAKLPGGAQSVHAGLPNPTKSELHSDYTVPASAGVQRGTVGA